MKLIFVKSAVIGLFVLASSTSFAGGCSLAKDNGHKGEQVGLKSGQCAVFDMPSTKKCGDMEVIAVSGWNNQASSIHVNNNASAEIWNHGDGGELLFSLDGPGTKYADLKGGADNNASLFICK